METETVEGGKLTLITITGHHGLNLTRSFDKYLWRKHPQAKVYAHNRMTTQDRADDLASTTTSARLRLTLGSSMEECILNCHSRHPTPGLGVSRPIYACTFYRNLIT